MKKFATLLLILATIVPATLADPPAAAKWDVKAARTDLPESRRAVGRPTRAAATRLADLVSGQGRMRERFAFRASSRRAVR